MRVERAAVAVVVLAGLAGCGSSRNTSAPSTALTTVAPNTAAPTSVTATLTVGQAQQVLRSVVDPATPVSQLSSLVDTTDAQIFTGLNTFAKAATQAGYTPGVFTVESVSPGGRGAATATVDVASPHAPQPVAVTYGYQDVDGTWKLSEVAAKALIALTNGPQ